MANDTDLDIVVGELEGKWAGTPVPKDDRSPVPDGRYQARVERTYFDCDKQGTTRFRWDLVIVAGPYAKRHLFRSCPLTPDWIESIKKDLVHSGATPPETMQGFKAMVEAGELLDRVVEVQVKTKGEYHNTFINAPVTGVAKSAPSNGSRREPVRDDEPPPVGDGDLPF
jgi:hypothetical protein